jgi:hypothetical protein
VSTSTTLAPNIEFKKEIPESELSVSVQEDTAGTKKEPLNIVTEEEEEEETEKETAPASELWVSTQEDTVQEDTIITKKETLNIETREEETDKPLTDEMSSSVSPESTSLSLSLLLDKKELEKEVIIDSVITKHEDSTDKIEVEKEVTVVTPETPSEIPFTRSIGDTNSEFISEDKADSPALAKESEEEPDELTRSKEDIILPDDRDNTMITDIDSVDAVSVNDIQEENSKRNRKAVIISSGIGAAVAVPVFLILFSKKEEKETKTISLTVEWP